jgi:hypothetical protein
LLNLQHGGRPRQSEGLSSRMSMLAPRLARVLLFLFVK